MAVPLLILSDAPTSGTGLGRITRDLATRIAQYMPDTFRVATAGYGGVVSRHLPFHQYVVDGTKDFVCLTLPEIWEDFAGSEKGILFSIWDLSRLGWLTRPEMNCEIPRLREFLLAKPFQLWSYLPIDASGPNGKLTFPLQESLKGVDRPLAYGKWAAGIVDRTIGVADEDQPQTYYLPHGIDSKVFYERNRGLCRKMFVSFTQAITLMGNLAERVQANEVLVGIIATNQARKDWQLAIEAFAILTKTQNARLWIKTDVLERHWSIPALLIDYGVADKAMISLGDMSDDQMAQAYSACDVVLGIAPEGFGYIHVESTACGTPCIVGSYAGGAELVSKEMHVDPECFRYEGVFSSERPVYLPWKWSTKSGAWIGKRVEMKPEYDWNILWPRWERYLADGV